MQALSCDCFFYKFHTPPTFLKRTARDDRRGCRFSGSDGVASRTGVCLCPLPRRRAIRRFALLRTGLIAGLNAIEARLDSVQNYLDIAIKIALRSRLRNCVRKTFHELSTTEYSRPVTLVSLSAHYSASGQIKTGSPTPGSYPCSVAHVASHLR